LNEGETVLNEETPTLNLENCQKTKRFLMVLNGKTFPLEFQVASLSIVCCVQNNFSTLFQVLFFTQKNPSQTGVKNLIVLVSEYQKLKRDRTMNISEHSCCLDFKHIFRSYSTSMTF
jgi:hypothetical protein